MQKIHRVEIHFGVPVYVPTGGRFLSAYFEGNDVIAHFITADEGTKMDETVFYLVDYSVDHRVPDGYQALGPVPGNQWSHTNFYLFTR